MFGEPTCPPPNSNILPLVWTYIIKTDGIKKDHCVCNGSPNRKGSITLAHTYAAALDQSNVRTFWDITNLHNYVVFGVDTTNAFAEAPAPKAPLYITINDTFKSWWEKVLKRPLIKKRHILPACHALQGQPESPKLWTQLIHNIPIGDTIKFTSTTHELCLYQDTIDKQPIFLLRQVDDFDVAAPSTAIANKIFALIQAKSVNC